MEHDPGKVREVLALLDDHYEGLNITAIARNVGINRNSLAKYLDLLIRDGRLEEQGFGKSRVFFRAHRLPFSEIIGVLSDPVIILNGDYVMVQANDASLEFFAISREALVGHSPGRLSRSWKISYRADC